MTYPSILSAPIGRLAVWVIALLISASSFIGCECINKLLGRDGAAKPSQGKPQIPPPNQVNLQLTGSAVDAAAIANAFSKAVTPNIPVGSITVRACPCDKGLVNVTLPGSYTIIIKGAEGPLAVKPPPGATGGGVDLPFKLVAGSNFRISPLIDTVKVRNENTRGERPEQVISTGGKDPAQTIPIAIFDTGLTGGYLPGTGWQQSTQQCAGPVTTSLSGWNFTNEGSTSQTNDLSPMHHGSRVAHLIAKQFNGSSVTAKIVPMKVLTAHLDGDLFGLLCAMETARSNHIQVFNMSLGYYGAYDSLFSEYVGRAIKANVKLIVAAGNRTLEDSIANVDRNFATMRPTFYPAGFGIRLDQVIVATTAHLSGNTLLSCGRQNYGSGLVFGVLAEQDCRFILQAGGESPSLITGSSYATPVLTGWLARKLVEKPDKIKGKASLPVDMFSAPGGQQLYKNAYVKSWSSPAP